MNVAEGEKESIPLRMQDLQCFASLHERNKNENLEAGATVENSQQLNEIASGMGREITSDNLP